MGNERSTREAIRPAEEDSGGAPGRRPPLVGKGWFQAALLVFAVGLFVLALLGYRVYQVEPPVPDKVVDPTGRVIFTYDDVRAGQDVFFSRGMMEYGSLFGHGAYLGPDFTTDYLHRAATEVEGMHAQGGVPGSTVDDFKTNRYDEATRTLTFTQTQARAFEIMVGKYGAELGASAPKNGLKPDAITDPNEIRDVTAFLAWSAWAASANRPGVDYSYTNNWPGEALVGNQPTGNVLVWSAISLIALLGGIGALFAAFGRWNILGWHGREDHTLTFRPPGDIALTPGQRATAWFFFVIALLFFLQTMMGGAVQHYRADPGSFYGFQLETLLPYNLARTWHVQLGLFWVAAALLAGGIFLAPMIAGREPKRQGFLVYVLLGAVAVVVFGSLGGEAASILGWFKGSWSWIGAQGLEYLDLGRFWQILLTAGLFFWVFLLTRVMRGRLHREHPSNLPWLFFFSALAIPTFYAVGLLARNDATFTNADYWRFIVVHLWVEDFLELFTTVLVAYIFVLLGVVSERTALRVFYLDITIYSVGGIIGTLHHAYFSGGSAEYLALGSVFSALEIMPLTFLTVEAWSFLRLGKAQSLKSGAPFPHKWAVMFLIAVGFWNFLGAGVMGFLINLPIISYYEIGTSLTANHGHAAMMGVYGMTGMALAMFCLRYLIRNGHWSDRLARISFWSLNIGLAWMVLSTLFPVGVLQLFESVNNGYYAARSMDFLQTDTVHWLEWARMPGDLIFIIGGVVPFLILAWKGVTKRERLVTLDEPEEILFTHEAESAMEPSEA